MSRSNELQYFSVQLSVVHISMFIAGFNISLYRLVGWWKGRWCSQDGSRPEIPSNLKFKHNAVSWFFTISPLILRLSSSYGTLCSTSTCPTTRNWQWQHTFKLSTLYKDYEMKLFKINLTLGKLAMPATCPGKKILRDFSKAGKLETVVTVPPFSKTWKLLMKNYALDVFTFSGPSPVS